MPQPRPARLPRIALAIVFVALVAHTAATLGAEHARYGMRDEALEQAPEQPGSRHYELRASLRAGDPATTGSSRYRAKAALGGESVASACDATDALFANGFE